MPKRALTAAEIDEIVRRDTGGARRVVRAAPRGTTDAATGAEAHSLDLEALRRKYFGAPTVGAGGGREDAEAPDGEDADEPDDVIVQTVPANAVDEPDGGPVTPKAVVISGKEGKIIGYQG